MDHYRRSLQNTFTTTGIDRVTDKRRDDQWLAARLEDETSLFIPVWRLENLFSAAEGAQPLYLSHHEVSECIPTPESTILLGVIGNRAYFALGLPSDASTPPVCLTDLGQFQDLRQMASVLNGDDATLLAYARAMTYWHCRHRHCGVCGSPTKSIEGGFQRVCTNDKCRNQHFPRTDPAIIVLVTCDDHALLGRKPIWPKGRHSTIAGFVEPGETLEEAVIREVGEETGVRVREMTYHSSQPWPFPSSLMLGFTARAASAEIQVDHDELENACWFTRGELRRKLTNGQIGLPAPISISFRLIEDWFDAGDCGRLRAIIPSDY
jgi:NAD+ diphosphatase